MPHPSCFCEDCFKFARRRVIGPFHDVRMPGKDIPKILRGTLQNHWHATKILGSVREDHQLAESLLLIHEYVLADGSTSPLQVPAIVTVKGTFSASILGMKPVLHETMQCMAP